MDSMVLNKISEKAPLIYYSYRKLVSEGGDARQVIEANKISIRKNFDYENNGLEVLVYDYSKTPHQILCDGLKNTRIVEADDGRIDFYGKGYDDKETPLTNMMGVFQYNNGMIELSTGYTDKKYITNYLNCYRDEHPDVFNFGPAHVQEFLRSTNGLSFDSREGNGLLYAARMHIMSYYKKKVGWITYPNPFINETEWKICERSARLISKCDVLKNIEEVLDSCFHNSYQIIKNGYESAFRNELDRFISSLGIYYMLYSTLDDESTDTIYRKPFVFNANRYEEYQDGKCIDSGRCDMKIVARVNNSTSIAFSLINEPTSDLYTDFELPIMDSSDVLIDRIQYGRLPQITIGIDPKKVIVCNIFTDMTFVRFAMTNPLRIIEYYGSFDYK